MLRRLCTFVIFALVCRAELRISSLNIAKKYGREIVGKIQAQGDLKEADILLLQEVVDGPKSHMGAEIANALGMHFAFAPAFQLNPDFKEGLAILSRYPLSASVTVPLAHNDLHFHTRERIALAATTDTPSGQVRIINTHLDNRINAEAKRTQLTAVLQEAERISGPCIIGGDFNNANFLWKKNMFPVPGLQSLRKLVDDEMQAHRFHTPLDSGQGTLHFLGLKLDWIYVRDWIATGSGVTPIPFSDHNSVWIKIEDSRASANPQRERPNAPR